MKTIKHIKLALAMLMALFTTASVHAQTMKYRLIYNICNANYEVHFVAQSPYALQANKLNIATSGVGIVAPATTVDGSFNVTAVNGGAWNDPSQVNAFLGNDYHKVVTGGGPVTFAGLSTIPAGTDILLFTFTIGSTPTCVPGVRLFYNWANPTSNPCSGIAQYPDPTELTFPTPDICSGEMPGGGDYRSSFQQLVPSSDTYRGNIANTGTTCFGFDFGDLTSTWPSARASLLTADCNNDGVPDGNSGAVWAGLLVDAEAAQNSSPTAIGDDTNGFDDEDGLTFPAGPTEPGYTYNYAVTLNSNKTAQRVFYGLWFDYNNDGSFSNDVDGNGSPAFFSGSGVTASPVTVLVPVKTPAGASPAFKVRLIVSDVAVTGSMFGALIANGEIEDYQAPPQILPVTFGNITAEAKNCNVYLSFGYLTQQNNKQFDIEYSVNSSTWQTLATLGNRGNNGANNYSYVHSSPAAGANYYRIKQIDLDGNYSYSKTVTATSSCDGKIRVTTYPNPVQNSLTVILPANMGKSQLRITDAVGKIITSISTQNSFNTINTQMLAAGMYLIEVINENKTIYTRKFVKE